MGEQATEATRYVAFLRAINVGGHTVKMDALREHFAALGFADVQTFIASGNVLFTAPGDPAALEAQIEGHLAAALGYEVVTFLRPAPALAAIAAAPPFADAPVPEDGGLFVGFLRAAPPPAARAAVEALASPTDTFALHDRELYWRLATRFSDLPITGARLERALGMPTTLRNITTVRRLAAKVS